MSKGIISADSHVSEPGDLWIERIDREYQFRAPRLESRERDGKLQDFFVYEGWPPHAVGVGLGAAAKSGESFRDEGKGYGDALTGGWDPKARLKDQDTDGVVAEFLYTTLGFRLYWMRDSGLRSACFRAYNDWLSDYCQEAPDRLFGLALISLGDVPAACQELRRARSLGHRGAMIPLSPAQGDPPYSSHAYDEFWATAQDLDIALVIHENTGGAESQLSQSSYWNPESSIHAVVRPHEVQRSIAQLVVSGVFERFPALRIVSAENGTDWLPWFIGRLGRLKQKTIYETPLTMLPIEYFRRNIFFTYIDEPWAVENLDVIGEDNLMFATDYPHTASTWPKSAEIVERDCADLPESTRDKLVHDNALAVFR